MDIKPTYVKTFNGSRIVEISWGFLPSTPAPSLILLIKGYFLRKSRIRIFLKKGGILVLTSVNFEKKRFNFYVQCFTVTKGVYLG